MSKMKDVIMSKMNGFELYSQLKEMDHDIKVCFLTASSETLSEELRRRKYCELNKDLFLEMPLPIKKDYSRNKGTNRCMTVPIIVI